MALRSGISDTHRANVSRMLAGIGCMHMHTHSVHNAGPTQISSQESIAMDEETCPKYPGQKTDFQKQLSPKNEFSQDRRVRNKCIHRENGVADFIACEAEKINSETQNYSQSRARHSKPPHQTDDCTKYHESWTRQPNRWASTSKIQTMKEDKVKTLQQEPQQISILSNIWSGSRSSFIHCGKHWVRFPNFPT